MHNTQMCLTSSMPSGDVKCARSRGLSRIELPPDDDFKAVETKSTNCSYFKLSNICQTRYVMFHLGFCSGRHIG